MTKLIVKEESNDKQDGETSKDEETTAEEEDEEEDEDEEDSGNEDDEDFLSEELNLPETEDDLESDSATDYPVIMDDSEEDRIFKRQLSYPPIPMYHPPPPERKHSQSSRGRMHNPRDKIGVLTPMEEVTEPPSSAATSIDGDRRNRSRGRRAGSITTQRQLSPNNVVFRPPSTSLMEQRSILKSKENLQEGFNRRVTFEGGQNSDQSGRSGSPTESQASNTTEYSSMADSGDRQTVNNSSKTEIQSSIIKEEAEETEEANSARNTNKIQSDTSNPKEKESKTKNVLPTTLNSKPKSETENKKKLSENGGNSGDLGLISDIEQGEKVIQWQMENVKSENGEETSTALDSEFPSIVNGIIAELHNLDELIGSFMEYSGVMEMNASKQDHLANVSTQLATYLAQVSAQTIITNLPQVIPLVTSLLWLTGSNFRSQLASLTAINVFIERLRDCKAHSGLRILPHADLTWLVRALCELSSESSMSVLKNEGILALARLIKTAGPEMVFDPILFILTGNDEKVRIKRKEGDDDDVVIPTGGPGGAPKLKAIALDSLTFALLTFPRDDFNLNLVAKLACHCLLHPKRRMRQGSLECLAVVCHALGSHVALPMFRQMIMDEEDAERQAATQNSTDSVSSDVSGSGSGVGSVEPSDVEAENVPPPKEPVPSRIPIPVSRANENGGNPMSPKKIKFTGSPIAAVSARISRHLLPTPSLNELVEYAVKIPASSKLLCRQNRAVSRQTDIISGGESGESGGSANTGRRRTASSSGTSSSSITNIELELEPVLNAIGSGRRKQTNDIANSMMAADVLWILAGTGPIKPCDGTSVLAPIYKLPETHLISDQTTTQTHIRQLGMLSSGMESDSSDQGHSKMQRMKMKGNRGVGTTASDNDGPTSESQDSQMGRGYYYQGNGNNNGMGRGGGGMTAPDNNNSGRMSSTGSYSLLPNKYSLAGNAMGGRPGGNANMHGPGGPGGDPMMSPHHMPGGTFDYERFGGGGGGGGGGMSMDGIDSYNNSALNSADPYDQNASLRAPSRANMAPLQPVHNLRDKYFSTGRPNMKPTYSDEDDRGINDPSESSASSDEEDEMQSPTQLKSEAMMKAERRASQISNKSLPRSNKSKDSRKSGKTPKSSKHSPKKGQKEGKAANGTEGEPDKVEQIVNRLQQEYQVYRVELDQTGPSPEELAASKKKRGELDSAGSNSRDSGVSIGAGSVASVHSPSVEQKHAQPSLGVPGSGEGENVPNAPENNSVSNATANENNNNTSGKKDGTERSSKRKSSLKSSKKSGASNSKAVQHAIDGDDGLSRNWKSTPDVASITDDYDPRMSHYRRMSTEHGIGGGVDHEIINPSPYHSTSNLGGAGDNFITLHRKPVLAGRRQSLSRPQDELERQLALIPNQQPTGRSSRLEYHQHQQHSRHQHQHGLQNGYGGIPAAGLGLLHHDTDHFHRHSSMLDMDKAPSRESSAGSGNTYSLLQHDSLHHPSLSSHHMRSAKSTGNLLGVGVDDIYGGISQRANPYYHEIMDHHTGSPGRRMPHNSQSHNRLAIHHPLADLGNSTDDMEFPMTPQSESSSNTLPKQSRGMITGRMNTKIVPKKVYKGSFREVNGRGRGNMGSINAELFADDLKPVTSPKHALPAALLQVQASDWETNVDGFRQLVRLARHHPEFIRSDLHNVNMNTLRHVMNLRSQVCRAAILFFRELFMNLGKAMEHDSERIAEKLLDKAADTTKFIREDSGKALEALLFNVSPAKALNCLDLYGTRHRNPAVRCMTARMTTKLIEKLGADRCLSEVPERLLPMLCRFLQEGSLDTRMSAKLAFGTLMESPSFDTQLKRHVSADTLRHVQKAMKTITNKS